MQIPTVTLEDLQAFHVQHFPGHETVGAPADEPEYEEDVGDDEDLGYYPDGVKRTLTDEQIRIFRHSEIHSLLRVRQLEQDDVEYEARQESFEKNHNTVADMKSQQGGSTAKDNRSKEITNKTSGEELVSAAKKSKGPAGHETDSTMSEPLSYEESHQTPSGQNKQPRNQNPYPGRRIISYDD
ncbi:uncharacterized protein N7503_007974 [Penicillium pulvis]|uniref:uncharacterized protein n=1 Tax=Penicillium pulvis TaxID=1562058 RepID=UPI00254950E1|nr:uncharacterized protein N7503_007974 [Penicillium pulvis]KAJ5791996.1 hypothetical protein N7503_007974 [Penicillium pulvis]